MSQSLAEKAAALRTLLPMLTAHLSLFPGAMKTPAYGETELEPGPPPPGWMSLDCMGRCSVCIYNPDTATGRDRCGGEPSERMADYLRRAYRMDVVAAAYRLLEEERPYLHRAVRLVYVEPWEREPISEAALVMRQRVAEQGVERMAEGIPGKLDPFWRTPAEEARYRREIIARFLADGRTYAYIQIQLGCSPNTISGVARSMGTLEAHVVR